MARDILHIDMDAFFAAVEQRDHPEWRGKPVVVGAPPDRRGVVSTCSYEARRFGVRSAMPSSEAGRRCPQAIFVSPDMARYEAVSRQVFEIFERFTPWVEPVSIDEAFLDITGAHGLFGDNRAIAERIRSAIRSETGGLTASVGVAGNRFLAKIGSEFNKPDGLTLVPRDPEEILAFLAPLPTDKLWGVGPVLCDALARAGLRTVGDIQRAAPSQLADVLGGRAAADVARLARGEDDRGVGLEWSEKSLSREHTFDTDCRDAGVVAGVLSDLAADVGRRLRRLGRYARTVKLKLRWADFETISRQRSLDTGVCDGFTLIEVARGLLAAVALVKPVRLVGFGVVGLITGRREQGELFDPGAGALRRKREALSRAADAISRRYGDGSVRQAGTTPV